MAPVSNAATKTLQPYAYWSFLFLPYDYMTICQSTVQPLRGLLPKLMQSNLSKSYICIRDCRRREVHIWGRRGGHTWKCLADEAFSRNACYTVSFWGGASRPPNLSHKSHNKIHGHLTTLHWKIKFSIKPHNTLTSHLPAQADDFNQWMHSLRETATTSVNANYVPSLKVFNLLSRRIKILHSSYLHSFQDIYWHSEVCRCTSFHCIYLREAWHYASKLSTWLLLNKQRFSITFLQPSFNISSQCRQS